MTNLKKDSGDFTKTSLLRHALILASILFNFSTFANSSNAQEPQVPTVEVEVIKASNAILWHRFSGRLEAVDSVEIKPQVNGTITKILFQEGSSVTKGDPLFIIDPRPYEAELSSAEAALSSALSQASLAKAELDRGKDLIKKELISDSNFDNLKNNHQVTIAQVKAARARLTIAKLNVEYANIIAPVSGIISRAEITEGNLVESGSTAPTLATIVSDQSLYAEFDVDEQTYIKFASQTQNQQDLKLQMTLNESPEGSQYLYPGKLHSFDNSLDTTTGTIRARAIFDNSDGILIPGMYVTVQVGQISQIPKLLISGKAVGTNQDKKYVYVVNKDSKINYREVTLGASIDDKRIVISGLKEGEKVLINSLQRVQPNMLVKPVEVADQKSISEKEKAIAQNL